MRPFYLLLAALLLVACKDGKSDSDSKKKSSSSEGSAKGPKDVDIDSVLSEVKCKSDDERKGCSCLKDFDSAKAFDDFPDDGGSTWVGRAYALGGSADGEKQYFFVQFKSGKADDDAIETAKLKSDAVLDFKASARALFPENDDEETDAKSLIKAVSGGSKAPKDSEAAKFVRTSKPTNGYHPIAKSKGKSKMIAEEHGSAYLRADGDRLLIAEYGEGNIDMGDKNTKKKLTAKAFCTELWKVR